MRLIDFFRKNQKPSSASVARERLQILVAHERIERHANSYLPQLKEDLLEVIPCTFLREVLLFFYAPFSGKTMFSSSIS